MKELKDICYLIGYEYETCYCYECCKYNVREIIFTQDFMDKYIKYCENQWIIAPSKYKMFLIDLHKNLDNSVEYLYNTLWLWTKHK